MKILVCIKQVPDSESAPKIDKARQWITYKPHMDYKINRFDEYALEEALILKDTFDNVSVDVITIGPENANKVIKRAFGMGADKGIHIVLDKNKYIDPYKTALMISEQAQKKEYDIIFTGIMSEDMMQAQTGQMIAEILKLPCGTGIVKLKIDPDKKTALAEREIEGGLREKIETKLPALFTIQAGINTPRYPSLSNILNASGKKFISVKSKENKAKQSLVSLDYPVKSRSGLFLTGSSDDKAKQLYTILKNKNAINK